MKEISSTLLVIVYHLVIGLYKNGFCIKTTKIISFVRDKIDNFKSKSKCGVKLNLDILPLIFFKKCKVKS